MAMRVLPLSEGLDLNPGMTGLKTLWDQGRLAIVCGVSYPHPDHSHFRSMDIWQTASPDRPQNTGWLGRWLDVTGHDPPHAVALEPVLPPMLAGATTAGAALPLRGLTLPTGPLARAFDALGGTSPGEPGPQALAARAITDLHRTAKTLGPALTRSVRETADGQHRSVVLVVYSEFGRRVSANANQGTDHGTAAPVLAVGAPVRGGFIGAQPSLTDPDNGDLKPTTGFRDVYATLLSEVLGAAPKPILGTGRTILPLITA